MRGKGRKEAPNGKMLDKDCFWGGGEKLRIENLRIF